MFDSLFPKEWTTLQRLMWLKTNALARAVYEIVTGNPVSFTARNAPLRKLEVAFSPVQDLHGYDSPWIDSEINREPYTLRGVKGTATRIGNFLYDKLAGGTIAWNQVIPVSAASLSRTANGVVFVDNRDGTYSVTTESGGATANEYIAMQSTNLPQSAKDHVYLFKGTPANGSDSTYRSYAVSSGFTQKFDYGDGYIVKATDIAPVTIVLAYIYSGANISSAITFKPQFIDLTQMFGSTIADYIYSLETATAGAGVAWFRSLFPNPYYAYDTGTLMSVKTSAHVTTEFNQWDEEWEVGYYNTSTGAPVASSTNIRSKNRIYVVGGTSYYVQIPIGAITIIEFDANDNFIKCTQGVANSGITVRPNCCYVLFHVTSAYGTTYKHDICINLSNPSRNGEYEPYVAHSYALDPDLELRGIPKLDADNALYYDGDTYEADGTVTRRYGIVDMGTLPWARYETSNIPVFYATVTDMKAGNAQLACAKYFPQWWTDLSAREEDTIQPHPTLNIVYVADSSYTDAETFAAAMSGVYLVYELETPTTESDDPFTNPQSVSEAGTEEYVDSRSVKIPVGHETYHANICPVEGWTGFNVSQAGKNLLTATEYSGIHYASGVGTDLKTTRAGVSYTENGNEITVTAGGWQGWIFATGLLAVGDYYIHFNCNDSNFRGAAFVTDENLIVTRANMTYGGGADGNTKITLTEPSRIALFVACGSSGSATITNLQVELGESYTEWKPYNPSSRSISITLGQTVYGGELDVVTGEGPDEMFLLTLDGTDVRGLIMAQTGVSGYSRLNIEISVYGRPKAIELPTSGTLSNIVCNRYKTITGDAVYLRNTGIGLVRTGTIISIYDPNLQTLEDWIQSITESPIQICYPKYSPTTITTTPTPINSLVGENNVWSDSNGDLTVTYRSN